MLNFIIKKIREKSLLHQFGVYIIKVSYVLFPVAIISFIGYFTLEQLKTGLISNYFDLNVLLVLALTSGLFIMLFGEKIKHRLSKSYKKSKTLLIIFLTLIVTVLIFQSLQNFSEMRYFISMTVATLSAIILFLFFKKDDD